MSGTQAEANAQNNVIVMKMSNLKKTLKENNAESDSEDDSDSEDEDDQPELEAAMIKHSGAVNRIRVG